MINEGGGQAEVRFIGNGLKDVTHRCVQCGTAMTRTMRAVSEPRDADDLRVNVGVD